MAIKKTNNMKKIINNLQKGVENSLEQVGVAGVANIQTNTPIKNGYLKRSMTFKKAIKGKKYKVTFGSALDYSIIVEFKPSRVQGFFRNTLANFKGEAKEIIERNISRL
jgi:hypothetical protein